MDNEDKNRLMLITNEILMNLSEEEKKNLKKKFGIDLEDVKSKEEIGVRFDVTRERIRKIGKRALKKLREKEDDDGPEVA